MVTVISILILELWTYPTRSSIHQLLDSMWNHCTTLYSVPSVMMGWLKKFPNLWLSALSFPLCICLTELTYKGCLLVIIVDSHVGRNNLLSSACDFLFVSRASHISEIFRTDSIYTYSILHYYMCMYQCKSRLHPYNFSIWDKPLQVTNNNVSWNNYKYKCFFKTLNTDLSWQITATCTLCNGPFPPHNIWTDYKPKKQQ